MAPLRLAYLEQLGNRMIEHDCSSTRRSEPRAGQGAAVPAVATEFSLLLHRASRELKRSGDERRRGIRLIETIVPPFRLIGMSSRRDERQAWFSICVAMATVAVGDIHGNLAALLDLLGQLRAEVADEDVVVFLGDYIDRGPDSKGCVETILTFRDESRADVVCLLGNHEDWLKRTQNDHTRHSWLLGMTALDTVRSYSPAAERTLREAAGEAGLRLYLGRYDLPYGAFFDAVPPSHREFFAQLRLSFQSSDCICTHAGLDPGVTTLADQTLESLVWGHQAFPADYRGEPTVVYGHWNNADLDAQEWPTPRIVGNTIGIDTISHGVLTAIRMPDRRVFQSARHAATRLAV